MTTTAEDLAVTMSSPTAAASMRLPAVGYRHVFAVIANWGFLILYALRVCMSITVVAMVSKLSAK